MSTYNFIFTKHLITISKTSFETSLSDLALKIKEDTWSKASSNNLFSLLSLRYKKLFWVKQVTNMAVGVWASSSAAVRRGSSSPWIATSSLIPALALGDHEELFAKTGPTDNWRSEGPAGCIQSTPMVLCSNVDSGQQWNKTCNSYRGNKSGGGGVQNHLMGMHIGEEQTHSQSGEKGV